MRRDGKLAKRLPRPANPIRARCELDESELKSVEDVAHLCRLSVASFIRVAMVDAAAHPERVDEWRRIADLLMEGTGESPPKRPGRPKKAKEGEPDVRAEADRLIAADRAPAPPKSARKSKGK